MNTPELASSSAASEAHEASAAAPAASIPFLRHESTGLESSGMGVGNALVIVFLCAALGVWFLRRYVRARGAAAPAALGRVFGGASARSLAVLESTRLTAKASAHVVQWNDRQWLVVCTDQSATVVGQAPLVGAAQDAEARP